LWIGVEIFHDAIAQLVLLADPEISVVQISMLGIERRSRPSITGKK
jgi:hypothetical protein